MLLSYLKMNFKSKNDATNVFRADEFVQSYFSFFRYRLNLANVSWHLNLSRLSVLKKTYYIENWKGLSDEKILKILLVGFFLHWVCLWFWNTNRLANKTT